MAENDINKNHDLEGVKGNLIKDHEYDGIYELDNKPPPWLMWILYATIVWSVAYMFHYHVFNTGMTQEEEYQAEMAEAEANSPVKEFDESDIELIKDEAKLSEAASLYSQKSCLTCHGANGEGNSIGPNLADKYWLHGNSPEKVFEVIKYGVPEKGMTPFKDQMTNEQIQMLTSYILLKIQGSNPPNAKEPEGDLVE